MPDDAAHDDVTAATPALRTLAGKVNWLIFTARPAGRGPYSDAEVAALIRTGDRGAGHRHGHQQAAQRAGRQPAPAADRRDGPVLRGAAHGLLLRRL